MQIALLAVADDSLYTNKVCRLCGKECLRGIARENHARKHQREGRVIIKGFGGPSGRRYEILPSALSALRPPSTRAESK